MLYYDYLLDNPQNYCARYTTIVAPHYFVHVDTGVIEVNTIEAMCHKYRPCAQDLTKAQLEKIYPDTHQFAVIDNDGCWNVGNCGFFTNGHLKQNPLLANLELSLRFLFGDLMAARKIACFATHASAKSYAASLLV